jgi:hypothetical protein
VAQVTRRILSSGARALRRKRLRSVGTASLAAETSATDNALDAVSALQRAVEKAPHDASLHERLSRDMPSSINRRRRSKPSNTRSPWSLTAPSF